VFFERPDKLVLEFLVKYSATHGKELIIVPCCGYRTDGTLQKEHDYYNKLLGQTCRFWPWRWHGSGYDATDATEVVVSIDSTLGYEAAARGNKTALFSVRSQLLSKDDRAYGWPDRLPDDGPYWTNRPDPAAFERILDHLFAIDDEQWNTELSANRFSDIMMYDPGDTTLQSVLNDTLGAPPPLRTET
jgi:surface carbohydrate biosynthesis protein